METITIRTRLKAAIADGRAVIQLDKSEIPLDGPNGPACLELLALTSNVFDVTFTPVAVQQEMELGELVTEPTPPERTELWNDDSAPAATVGESTTPASDEPAISTPANGASAPATVPCCPKCLQTLTEGHVCPTASTSSSTPTNRQRQRAEATRNTPPEVDPDDVLAEVDRREGRRVKHCAHCDHVAFRHSGLGRACIVAGCGCPTWYEAEIENRQPVGAA